MAAISAGGSMYGIPIRHGQSFSVVVSPIVGIDAVNATGAY